MGDLIPAADENDLARVVALEDEILKMPQVQIATDHVFHAGCYLRTIIVPPSTIVTGALMKIPTALIVSGDCELLSGSETIRLTGYHVLTGQAGRKQAVYAYKETAFTMIFATEAQTIEEAEKEFTGEFERLFSRVSANSITGGGLCPVEYQQAL